MIVTCVSDFQLYLLYVLHRDAIFLSISLFSLWQDGDNDKANGAQELPSEGAKGNSENQQKGDQQPISTANKACGKNAKLGSQASDPPKEEYIHVRARRGQATNSHSLAERVRFCENLSVMKMKFFG